MCLIMQIQEVYRIRDISNETHFPVFPSRREILLYPVHHLSSVLLWDHAALYMSSGTYHAPKVGIPAYSVPTTVMVYRI